MKKIEKITVSKLRRYKAEGKKITALTAYDYSTAKILDEAGIDIVLVGDSLAIVALGQENTLSVTLEEILYHTKAVSKGVSKALLVADMPFMSYHVDVKQALINAGKLIKQAGATAVKIEGAGEYILEVVRRFTEVGIPVLGHIGFTPQALHNLGGYYIQGKDYESANNLLLQAQKLQNAGVFGIVIEMVPEETAEFITKNIDVPTIGIGAGRFCDGQILVTDDIIGKFDDFKPKFVRKYANVSSIVKNAVSEYKNDVLNGNFPSNEEVFKTSEANFKDKLCT
jgi:3-methyl-2-oxobutanoate hydroxymethyltransferase